ncbi:TPA: hypothetical protein QCY85_005537 [Bacillus cereus]|nr:hypothetical protein [Bacillus cereus]HDR8117901.1 hypothetical protein [Bacillus cereus]
MISYCQDFKIRAVKETQLGKDPSQIFLENVFDLAVIGEKKPKQCLKHWRRTFEKFGEEGFYTEHRWKGRKGRPSENLSLLIKNYTNLKGRRYRRSVNTIRNIRTD